MKIERVIRKEEEANITREMWEINHDEGWELPKWETIARRETLEEAFAVAAEKGYIFSTADKDLTTYHKYEDRTVDNDAKYVADYFDKTFGDYIITHYYIFD